MRWRASRLLATAVIGLAVIAPVALGGMHTVNRYYHGKPDELLESRIEWSAVDITCAELKTGIYHLKVDGTWMNLGYSETSCGWYQWVWASHGEDNCQKYGWNQGDYPFYHVAWHGHKNSWCY
jgi:hypothetical protein